MWYLHFCRYHIFLLFCGLILKEYLKIFRPINLLIGYVANVAMQLFANYIDAATAMSESCGGGGGFSS